MVLNPTACSYNTVIKQIACGSTHTHILSYHGEIYSFGSNANGKLGLGLSQAELPFTNSPILINTLPKVQAIAAGSEHSLAVGKNHKAYGWG